MSLVLWILTCFNLVTWSHKCVHNNLKKSKIHQIENHYKEHPYELMEIKIKNSTEYIRRLLYPYSAPDNSYSFKEVYKSIRIKAYYNYLDNSNINNENKIYVKKLISSSIKYFENILSVIPVDGPLYLGEHDVNTGYMINNSMGKEYINGVNYINNNYYCGYNDIIIDIPVEFYKPKWIWNVNNEGDNIPDNIIPNNTLNGVDNADFVIFISVNQTNDCDINTLAYALTCINDQYGRPIAGYINFCENALTIKSWSKDVMTTVHELTHALAFSDNLYTWWINQDTGQTYGTFDEQPHIITDGIFKYVNTPKLVSVAKEYYNCYNDSIILGVPLENNGDASTAGSHFEEYHLNDEYMIGTSYSSLQKVSKFSLALFEDTGWYKVNYKYAHNYQWGKNKGCAFWNINCNKTTNLNTYSQYWCNNNDVESDAPNGGSGCIMNNNGIGYCRMHVYNNNNNIPQKYQWFSDAELGGSVNSQYCPFITPKMNSIEYPNYNYYCFDDSTGKYNNFGVYSHNSRCINYNNGITKEGGCNIVHCIDYNDTTNLWNAIEILFYRTNVTVQCNRDDMYTYKNAGGNHTMECPNIDWICWNKKPFNCVWGHYSNELDRCLCNVGYNGEKCDIIDDNINSEDEAIIINHYSTDILYSNTSNDNTLNGQWIVGGIYGVYNYYVLNNLHYMYFDAWLHMWLISDTLGSDYTNMIRICSSNNITFILPTNCQWYTDIYGVILDPTFTVYITDTTLTPTISPTLSPTLEPTFTEDKATEVPTNIPTNILTMTPTDISTNTPTVSVSNNISTNTPSLLPSVSPTNEPTFNPTMTATNKKPRHKIPFGFGGKLLSPSEWTWMEYVILSLILLVIILIYMCIMYCLYIKRVRIEKSLAVQPQFAYAFKKTKTLQEIEPEITLKSLGISSLTAENKKMIIPEEGHTATHLHFYTDIL